MKRVENAQVKGERPRVKRYSLEELRGLRDQMLRHLCEADGDLDAQVSGDVMAEALFDWLGEQA